MNIRLEELEEKYSQHLQPTVKLLQVRKMCSQF